MKNTFWENTKTARKIFLGSLFISLIALALFVQSNPDLRLLLATKKNYFLASVFQYAAHTPFDGTVLPLKKTLNWVALSRAEYDQFKSGQLTYSTVSPDKLIDLPVYNPTDLANDPKTTKDKNILNELLTYVTAYMGKYTMGAEPAIELTGSHLAVDIRAAKGTPVYAIANGVIVKINNKDGEEKKLTILHRDVPDPKDPSKKINIYSSYLHLDTVSAKAVGSVVTKEELIGTVGNTGLATTYHLHFQIDREDAPWHPWWPFSWDDASKAGLDFFTAVNAGLGRELAIAYTINPMVFVQNNIRTTTINTNANSAPINQNTNALPLNANTNTVSVVNENINQAPLNENMNREVIVVPENTNTPVELTNPNPIQTFVIDAPSTMKMGVASSITISTVDQAGEPTSSSLFGTATLTSTQGSADMSPSTLSADQIIQGKVTVTVTPRDTLPLIIKVAQGAIVGESKEIEITQTVTSFNDVQESHPNYKAISYLKKNNIIAGYTDGTFKPDKTVTRVEALKMLILGAQVPIERTYKLSFPDTKSTDWFADYVGTALVKQIVSGYPDGRFLPGQNMNRAEYLKILLKTYQKDVATATETTSYSDISASDWFYTYATYTHEKNLLPTTNNTLDAGIPITRGEVAETVYRMIVLNSSGKERFENTLAIDF